MKPLRREHLDAEQSPYMIEVFRKCRMVVEEYNDERGVRMVGGVTVYTCDTLEFQVYLASLVAPPEP